MQNGCLGGRGSRRLQARSACLAEILARIGKRWAIIWVNRAGVAKHSPYTNATGQPAWSRGSVQQGLFAAGGTLGFYQLGIAADKRYSLAAIADRRLIATVNPQYSGADRSSVHATRTAASAFSVRSTSNFDGRSPGLWLCSRGMGEGR